MNNVNKSLCYVGPILKVISCLDYANVLLCNSAKIQLSDDITKGFGKL